MNLLDYVKKDLNNKCYLKIKVIPNAKITEFYSVIDDEILKIRIKSLPEKWRANKELIHFISKELWVKEKNILIISWIIDRVKFIRIDF